MKIPEITPEMLDDMTVEMEKAGTEAERQRGEFESHSERNDAFNEGVASKLKDILTHYYDAGWHAALREQLSKDQQQEDGNE